MLNTFIFTVDNYIFEKNQCILRPVTIAIVYSLVEHDFIISYCKMLIISCRPLAGYGLPPPRGNFVDHIFLKAQCLARILQHVSPLTMAALSCNSLLHTLPYKIFDN